MGEQGGTEPRCTSRRPRLDGRGAIGLVVVVLLVVAAAACRPLPMGSPSATMGNDVELCPQRQPSLSSPCGPQPMVWASIQGPYEDFHDGDPYATKCGRNRGASVANCTGGPYAGGATNELYDPTGYEYAIDVAAEDVGRALTFEVYDAGTYKRTVGFPYTTTTQVNVTRTEGSDVLTRSSGSGTFLAADVGRVVTGTGIPVGATIVERTSTTSVRLSVPVESTGTGQVSVRTPRVVDCDVTQAPFTSAPFFGTVTSQGCQTGDNGAAPIQIQLFENDGDDDAVGFDVPIPGCHLYLAAGTGAATHENAWSPVCTFTPTQPGVYPFRVKSSAIVLPDGTVIADGGTGWNQFALRVSGGTGTRVHALDALSIYVSGFAGTARFNLAEITSGHAGRRLQIDVFDPGDGAEYSQASLQVLAPGVGPPAGAPTGGTTIPAAGVADSCRYNATASATRGPDVAAPKGSEAAVCRVTTKVPGPDAYGIPYDNGWLSIEVDISPDYACDENCWWVVEYQFSSGSTGGGPNDRLVLAPVIVDRPAGPDAGPAAGAASDEVPTEPSSVPGGWPPGATSAFQG